MAKLVIEIEGTDEEIKQFAGHLSDGGAEDGLIPMAFEETGKYLDFDYARCFPSWGYDPHKHGEVRVVTAQITKK